MIMDAKLKVRLRVLIPAVENAIAGDAFRPLDVYPSRKGLTVEIGNTDAEGRLVLADALALADEEKPELIVDMATLTGAARVALGPDLPPFYTDDDTLAADFARHADAENDPMWRMPLWQPYDAMLDSKIADINNVGGRFAGSITAALFLNRFVAAAKTWVHFDIYGWTPSAKPARPEGGECQVARALYALLRERYGEASKFRLTRRASETIRLRNDPRSRHGGRAAAVAGLETAAGFQPSRSSRTASRTSRRASSRSCSRFIWSRRRTLCAASPRS